MAERPPLLPLLLWRTPPALAGLLGQEGVPFREIRHLSSVELSAGRFVIFDPSITDAGSMARQVTPQHVAIPAHGPFSVLLDTRAARLEWPIEGLRVAERVGLADRVAARRMILGRLQKEIERAGGVWARLSVFPAPYRSAFNLRLDLDESIPADYWSFARSRRPIEDCTTHFVSTAAYGNSIDILRDVASFDAQSHGHHHVVYRDEGANRRNLERARDLLTRFGIDPEGFAGPEGRWNPGLDQAMASVDCQFSSEFSVGRDDLPFFPWLGDRFSHVLQIPVHPVCEGVILEAGGDSRVVTRHLVTAVRELAAADRPAFVYGHPEYRLGRMPEVIAELAASVADLESVWRTTLSAFARWWRWRLAVGWSLVEIRPASYVVRFDKSLTEYTPTIELFKNDSISRVVAREPQALLSDLQFQPRPPEPRLPSPARSFQRPGLRQMIRQMIDWETVTPIDELPNKTVRERIKKHLRRRRTVQGGSPT